MFNKKFMFIFAVMLSLVLVLTACEDTNSVEPTEPTDATDTTGATEPTDNNDTTEPVNGGDPVDGIHTTIINFLDDWEELDIVLRHPGVKTGEGTPFFEAVGEPTNRDGIRLSAVNVIRGVVGDPPGTMSDRTTVNNVLTNYGSGDLIRTISYALNGEYSVLSGVMGRIDGSMNQNAHVAFLGDDGEWLGYFFVLREDPIFEFSVDVSGVNELTIVMHAGGATYGIAELVIE